MQKYANLVELEKCCRTHIFLQNFVLIQPRTSPPKICKILLIFPILLTLTQVQGPFTQLLESEKEAALAYGARNPEAAELLGLRGDGGEGVPDYVFCELRVRTEFLLTLIFL